MANDLSKQEYLKRYLEDNDKEKKRKKKVKGTKSIIPRIKILDNDIGIKSINFGTKEEVEEDETPLIAEVIDERPVEVKLKEIYESSKWKKLGDDDPEITDVPCDSTTSDQLNGKQIQTNSISLSNKKKLHGEQKKKAEPHKNNKRHDSDSDLSPPQTELRHDSDSDVSPPRKQNHRNENRQRHDSDSDNNSSKKIENSMVENRHSSLHKRKSKFSTNSNHETRQNNSDSDLSPERENSNSKKSNRAKNYDSDLSPERQHHRRSPTRIDSDGDLSPPRERAKFSLKDESHRPTKTLSGLKAGLQNATTLREENKELREREKTQIRQLDAELSGRNANTIVRDRQTGLKRNIEEEMHLKEQKERKNTEQQQKYAEWGKGIEQTENKKSKLTEDLYEMSKPLARYCDDEDLEERLKAEIHDDDPMAQYMRKKKHKDTVSTFPVYSGPPPPPNRFRILPGYRWDGVDRSNGFEKKYFEQKSSKKAVEEEAYLWSVQNM